MYPLFALRTKYFNRVLTVVVVTSLRTTTTSFSNLAIYTAYFLGCNFFVKYVFTPV